MTHSCQNLYFQRLAPFCFSLLRPRRKGRPPHNINARIFLLMCTVEYSILYSIENQHGKSGDLYNITNFVQIKPPPAPRRKRAPLRRAMTLYTIAPPNFQFHDNVTKLPPRRTARIRETGAKKRFRNGGGYGAARAAEAHWRVDIRGEMFLFIKHPRQSVRAQRDGVFIRRCRKV